MHRCIRQFSPQNGRGCLLTVDSVASETVVPPGVARNLPFVHISRMGTEYEVANGGVVVNLGEKQADMMTKFGNKTSMIMSFQSA